MLGDSKKPTDLEMKAGRHLVEGFVFQGFEVYRV